MQEIVLGCIARLVQFVGDLFPDGVEAEGDVLCL